MSIPRPTRTQAEGIVKNYRPEERAYQFARAYLAQLDEIKALRAEVTRLNGVILKAAVQTVDDSQ